MAGRVIVILIVLCLGGFVLYTQNVADNPQTSLGPGDDGENVIVDQSDGFEDPNVKGVKPDTEAIFNVEVDLTFNGEQPNLNFIVTEQHGWYAGTVVVQFWYVEKDEDGTEYQVGTPIETLCRKFLPFNGVLEHKTTPTPIEFPDVSDWGTSENWRARVSRANVLAPSE